MDTKKVVAAGVALAAAGFIGAGMAQAAQDAFILGGPGAITVDVLGTRADDHCDLRAGTTPRVDPQPLRILKENPSGSNVLRIKWKTTPGTYYVDVTCGSTDKIVKKNVVVRVF